MPYFINGTVLSHPINYQENSSLSNCSTYWNLTLHQTKVTDKTAYGKDFGKAMFVVSMSLLLSGIISLFGASEVIAMIAVAVLFIGLFIGIAWIVAVQMKYNKGIF